MLRTSSTSPSSSSSLSRCCRHLLPSLFPSCCKTFINNTSSSSSITISPRNRIQARFAVVRPVIVSQQKHQQESDKTKEGSLCESAVPDSVLILLKNCDVVDKSKIPRCGWGYLLKMTSTFSPLLTTAEADETRRNIVSSLRQRFRPEFDLLETDSGLALRHVADAVSIIQQASSSPSNNNNKKGESQEEADMLAELAVEDIVSHLSSSASSARGFDQDEVADFLTSVSEESDELANIADKWTIETVGRAGGVEASLFAQELKDMYLRYCRDVRRWNVEDISTVVGDGSDSASASSSGAGASDQSQQLLLRVTGKNVYQYMRHEIGVHRVQRVPVTEAAGRMQTSTASVFLMPQPSSVSVNINPSDCEIDMVRGGGPGGQGVNSSSNACRLLHKPTGITIRCHHSRSGNANREMAMDMLAQKLWRKKYEQSKKAHDDVFASQWTSGERGERMRTYNFPQNRISDHRYNWNCNTAAAFMTGSRGGPLEELHEIALAESKEKQMRQNLDERLSEINNMIAPLLSS